MRYVEAPEIVAGDQAEKTVFLAGGITDCPDWQAQMVELLKDTDLTLFNPRRADFPIGDPSAAQEQIRWEHNHLRIAGSVLYWFPKETLCPIVLYELGAWSMMSKPIFVGVEPGYKRDQDVCIQTALVRPEVVVYTTLEALALEVTAAHEPAPHDIAVPANGPPVDWTSGDENAPWGECPEDECIAHGIILEKVGDIVVCPECGQDWAAPGPNAPQ